MIKEFIKLENHENIFKRIIKESNNDQAPVENNIVNTLIKGTFENGEIFELYDINNPYKFQLGDENIQNKLLNIAIITMKKNEISEFKINSNIAFDDEYYYDKIPKNTDLYYEIALLDIIIPDQSKFDYNSEERLNMGKEFKNKADNFLRNNNFEKSIELYEKCLDFIDFEKFEEVPKIKASCHSNLSLIYLKTKNYNLVIKSSFKVIEMDKNSFKAYYRLGLAYYENQEYEISLKNLKFALKLDEGNKAIINAYKACFNDFKQFKNKEKKNYSKILNNFDNKYLDQHKNKVYVFLDINYGEINNERVEIELYNNILPKTCENFRFLCDSKNDNSDKILSYKNTIFHRLIKGFIIQGGDIINNNGSGGKSIYGDKFKDENFLLEHNERGLLSMANTGPDSNSSQFFITFDKTPWLNGKNVVFGKIIKNIEFLSLLENLSVNGEKPAVEIKIINCGEIK